MTGTNTPSKRSRKVGSTEYLGAVLIPRANNPIHCLPVGGFGAVGMCHT